MRKAPEIVTALAFTGGAARLRMFVNDIAVVQVGAAADRKREIEAAAVIGSRIRPAGRNAAASGRFVRQTIGRDPPCDMRRSLSS